MLPSAIRSDPVNVNLLCAAERLTHFLTHGEVSEIPQATEEEEDVRQKVLTLFAHKGSEDISPIEVQRQAEAKRRKAEEELKGKVEEATAELREEYVGVLHEKDKHLTKKSQQLWRLNAAAVLITLIVFSGGIWWQQTNRQEASKTQAKLALSNLEKNPQRSLRQAIEAAEIAKTEEAKNALTEALSLQYLRTTLSGHKAALSSARI